VWIKRIKKDSKLDNINLLTVGEKVELVGISGPNQQQTGRVKDYDYLTQFLIVLTRESPEEIHSTHYFATSSEIIRGSSIIVKKGDVNYSELDRDLMGVGL